MMTREGLEKALRPHLDSKPFQPFVLELDDGRKLVVEKREALMFYAGAPTYFYPNGEILFLDAEDVRGIVELRPASSAQ